MAGQQRQPKQGNIAAAAAVLVLAGWYAAPVLAAPDRSTACDKNREATLEIQAETVATTIEAVADNHLLKPGVEATARKVFTDSDGDTDEALEIESEDEETAAPRLRPVSDNEVVPVKRQMFRRDI